MSFAVSVDGEPILAVSQIREFLGTIWSLKHICIATEWKKVVCLTNVEARAYVRMDIYTPVYIHNPKPPHLNLK